MVVVHPPHHLLDASESHEALGHLVVAAQHEPRRIRAHPTAHVELRMVGNDGVVAHEDAVELRPQLMYEGLRPWRGDEELLAVTTVEAVVGRASPFQHDVGPAQRVAGDEPAVELEAFLLQHAHGDLYSGIANLLNAPSAHLGKRVYAAAHHALDALADDEVGAGRSLAVVGTRLERDVDGGLLEQGLILWPHRGEGVDLGMALSAMGMIAFADDAAVATNDHCAHHGIGAGTIHAVAGQLKATAHVEFVGLLLIHFFVFCLG